MPENEAGPHVVCRLEVRDPDAGDVPECTLAELDDPRPPATAHETRPPPLPFELQPLPLDAGADADAVARAAGARLFALRSTAGQTFDHEARARYSLRVTCRDRTRLSVARDVTVLVLDANEPPVFARAVYTAQLPEDSRLNVGEANAARAAQNSGARLLELNASDDQLAVNGEHPTLTYAIESSSDEVKRAFRVDPASGHLFRRDGYVFDRERLEWYNFSVSATDNGQPPLAAAARVLIHVVDVNDNAPRFVAPQPAAREPLDLTCTQLISSHLYQFRAEDADIVTTAITYTLMNATTSSISSASLSDEPFPAAASSDLRAHFRVDQTSGALSLVKQLLCLDVDQYITLVIRASDGELNASTSFAIVVRRPTVRQAVDEAGDFLSELKRVFAKTENMNLLILLLIVGFTLIICIVLVAIIVCLRRRERRFATASSGSVGGEEAERLAEKTARIRQRMAKRGSKAARRSKSKSKSKSTAGDKHADAGSKLQTNSSVLYRSASDELELAAAGVGDTPHLHTNERERDARVRAVAPLALLRSRARCGGGGGGCPPPFLAVVPQAAGATAAGVHYEYVPLAETHPHTCACGLFADEYPASCYVCIIEILHCTVHVLPSSELIIAVISGPLRAD